MEVAFGAGKASIRDLARRFDVGRCALDRHSKNHSEAAELRVRRKAAKGGRPTQRTDRRAGPAQAPVTIESPADVFRELTWLYGENRELLANAKRTHDARLTAKSLEGLANVLDKFAKALKVYDDGANVIVDNSTKVLAVLAKMPEEDLRRLLDGERAVPPVAIATHEHVGVDDAA